MESSGDNLMEVKRSIKSRKKIFFSEDMREAMTAITMIVVTFAGIIYWLSLEPSSSLWCGHALHLAEI